MRRRQQIIRTIVLTALLVACADVTDKSIATETVEAGYIILTPSSIPTIMPSPTSIPTSTPEPAVSPGCMVVNDEGQFYVLSDLKFRDLWSHVKEMDQALAKYYPDWALYEQIVFWDAEPVKLSEIINSASWNNELNLQVNSTVVLVTLGTSMDWQLPANNDLYLESREISLKLNDLAMEWERPGNENIHAQFPEVANAATYALYLFHDKELERLRDWCHTYMRLFGASP